MVADGIAANNLLPFGTKFMIPSLYGNKIFTVQDRMNVRMGTRHADLWFPTREAAIQFGRHQAEIQVIES